MEAKRIQTFIEEGSFYRGNLHSHTTYSDGVLTPKEVAQRYKDQGYDFIAITDHNVYGDYQDLQEGLLIIPGFEGNVRMPQGDYREFHIVYLNESNTSWEHLKRIPIPYTKKIENVSDYISNIKKQGFLAMLAHPHWSLLEVEDILQLSELDFVEFYNYGSDYLENMGNSYVLWQSLWRKGMRRWGVGVDDNHNHHKDNYSDSFGGYVCVKANECTTKSIVEALKAGSFYTSTKPEIKELYIQDGTLHLECSPVNTIYLNNEHRLSKCIKKDGQTLIDVEISTLKATYITVTIVDKDGFKAYSNPIHL